MKYTLDNGQSNPSEAGFRGNTLQKLPVCNWLADLPQTQIETDLVEVQFKNTRKGYYLNNTKLDLVKGEKVAVEALPGHDIGEVTLTGRLVQIQIKKNHINPATYEVKRIFRKARPADLEKYEESKSKEQATMIKARQIAQNLHLEMKIGDVEYQGDGNKAIFYYIADGRVDFRQLIKVLAEEFRVRIEMKQIGARQEAGRIGGIGPCGRELCCAKWMSNFVSVSTSAARYQDLSTNPLKLAGQCAKIKCCVNFEVSTYVDAMKDLPAKEVALETKDGTFYHFKTDVFKQMVAYSTSQNFAANLVTISAERAKEIIALNKKGLRPDALIEQKVEHHRQPEFQNVVGQDSLTRFDSEKGGRSRSRGRNRDRDRRPRKNGEQANAAESASPKTQQGPRSDRPDRQERPERAARPERPEREAGENGNNNNRRRSNNRHRPNNNNRKPNNPNPEA